MKITDYNDSPRTLRWIRREVSTSLKWVRNSERAIGTMNGIKKTVGVRVLEQMNRKERRGNANRNHTRYHFIPTRMSVITETNNKC